MLISRKVLLRCLVLYFVEYPESAFYRDKGGTQLAFYGKFTILDEEFSPLVIPGIGTFNAFSGDSQYRNKGGCTALPNICRFREDQTLTPAHLHHPSSTFRNSCLWND